LFCADGHFGFERCFQLDVLNEIKGSRQFDLTTEFGAKSSESHPFPAKKNFLSLLNFLVRACVYGITLSSALIYARVSTSEQGESGLGLEAQVTRCTQYAERNNMHVLDTVCEVQSGKNMTKRPLLLNCLQKLQNHEADVLIVAKLDPTQ
jgi:Resolvase, N terminal domain